MGRDERANIYKEVYQISELMIMETNKLEVRRTRSSVPEIKRCNYTN